MFARDVYVWTRYRICMELHVCHLCIHSYVKVMYDVGTQSGICVYYDLVAFMCVLCMIVLSVCMAVLCICGVMCAQVGAGYVCITYVCAVCGCVYLCVICIVYL